MKYSIAFTSIIPIILMGFSAFGQTITLMGKVSDADSGNPLEFANVALLDPSDSSVMTGGMTDLNGAFEFDAKAGTYIFRVGFIGYGSFFQDLTLGDRPRVNFGNIKLVSDAADLEEVTVQGVISMFETDIDKRVY